MWSKTGRLKCWYYSESSPTWQQRQGKAGRDCPRYNTDIRKSKRETHPGRKWDSGEEKQTAEEAARGGKKRRGQAQGHRHEDRGNYCKGKWRNF